MSEAYLGESIPKLGFGLMRLPKLPVAEGESPMAAATDIEQVKRMVDAFMAAGLTYFDTARAYGTSEADIRQALVERYPRDSYYLATKNACWIGAKSAEEARAMFQTSLDETGAGYFDFYLIHNIGDKRTDVFDKYDMWNFVIELKEKGLVKHIGFSMHDSADELERVYRAHPEMEFVQLQVNYADWDNSQIQSRKCVERATELGLPIIIMEPVKGGMLANPPEPVREIIERELPGADPVDLALRFAWDVPANIITVLSGMSAMEQMEQNIAHYQAYKPLSGGEKDTLKRVQEKLDEITVVPCTYCRYCTKGCPVGLEIPGLLQALNLEAAYGHASGAHQHGWISAAHKAGECIQCGACEVACPQSIEIVHWLEVVAEHFEK